MSRGDRWSGRSGDLQTPRTDPTNALPECAPWADPAESLWTDPRRVLKLNHRVATL
jgi:hypothetical protein